MKLDNDGDDVGGKMKSLKYIGEVTKKSGNFSIFTDSKGDEKKIFGGVVGDVVIYSEARDLLFLVEKKLWQLLSTIESETTKPNHGTSSEDTSTLQAEIDRLKAIIEALNTSDNAQVLGEINRLSEELKAKEKELEKLKEQADNLAKRNKELEQSTNRLNELNDEIARLNERLREQTTTSSVEAIVL